MFDVFYSGTAPGLFAHEQAADSIAHAQQLSRTRYFWWVNYLTDYTGWDFLWEPVPWQKDQRHAWPSQWQKDSGTYLVPKQGYIETHYRADKQLTRSKTRVIPIIEIDHMDSNAGQVPGTVKTVRYFDNYRDVLTRIAKTVEHEYVWIVGSVCDYSGFDFSWHPEFWQTTMLHVFASDGEKFGDTFYMHVPSFRQRIGQFELLDWYDLNFVGPGVPRRPMPIVQHDLDTHVEAIKTMDWPGPLAVFSTDGQVTDTPTVPLWREKTKTIVPLSAGASHVIVPKTAVPYIKSQLYDYAHIDRSQRHLHDEQPLDIVFIENGEPNALDNLRALSSATSSRDNRVVVSKGITGRVAAYHAAAEMSTTPWFFAVFAKLQVNPDFDWSWQPDRMQEPKHYIFHAFNPVTGLTYGHQAMIAYNKKLVLANTGPGLDFTLDSAHEVVPILSGTADYASTPWMAWRTAFRECVKLCGQTDVESEYRLRKWLEVIPLATPNAEWSRRGAEDAVEYYDSVDGDITELKKSYDWSWLATYALIKRNLSMNQ